MKRNHPQKAHNKNKQGLQPSEKNLDLDRFDEEFAGEMISKQELDDWQKGI